ncbi:uncharacterized protein LOC136069392 [Quercus suber]|uniref:uncharacterized protein LOC136069392 n=1 Tax=Quercus suber TaxID=58331 RepID=UPI0032DEA2E9
MVYVFAWHFTSLGSELELFLVDCAVRLGRDMSLDDLEAREQFAVTAWFIWNRRNKIRLHQTVTPPSQLPSEISHYLLEYRKFNAAPVKLKPVRGEKWKPPRSGCIKTNFDGAVFADTDEVGIGVVIRDSRGQVLASLSKRIVNPSSVAVLELLASSRAVMTEIIINALKNGVMFNSAFGHLLFDTLYLLNSLKSWSLCILLRWEYVPPDVVNFVSADVVAL